MTYTAAMAITGVLRNPVGGRPIPEGIAMYRALAEQFNLCLMADPDTNPEDWANFVLTEQLYSHTGPLMYPDFGPATDAENRLIQVTGLRHTGYAVAFVIEPDPATCALLLQKGYNTVLFTHAQYAHPDWRPDTKRKPRSWDELQQQVADNAAIRARDQRMEMEHE